MTPKSIDNALYLAGYLIVLTVWAAITGPLDWQRLAAFTIGAWLYAGGLALWWYSRPASPSAPHAHTD